MPEIKCCPGLMSGGGEARSNHPEPSACAEGLWAPESGAWGESWAGQPSALSLCDNTKMRTCQGRSLASVSPAKGKVSGLVSGLRAVGGLASRSHNWLIVWLMNQNK